MHKKAYEKSLHHTRSVSQKAVTAFSFSIFWNFGEATCVSVLLPHPYISTAHVLCSQRASPTTGTKTHTQEE